MCWRNVDHIDGARRESSHTPPHNRSTAHPHSSNRLAIEGHFQLGAETARAFCQHFCVGGCACRSAVQCLRSLSMCECAAKLVSEIANTFVTVAPNQLADPPASYTHWPPHISLQWLQARRGRHGGIPAEVRGRFEPHIQDSSRQSFETRFPCFRLSKLVLRCPAVQSCNGRLSNMALPVACRCCTAMLPGLGGHFNDQRAP